MKIVCVGLLGLAALLLAGSCGDGEGLSAQEPLIAAPVAPVSCYSITRPCHFEGDEQICADMTTELIGKLVVTEIPAGSKLANVISIFGGVDYSCHITADCGWAVGSNSATCRIEEFVLDSSEDL